MGTRAHRPKTSDRTVTTETKRPRRLKRSKKTGGKIEAKERSGKKEGSEEVRKGNALLTLSLLPNLMRLIPTPMTRT
jgi:hypothetical protein